MSRKAHQPGGRNAAAPEKLPPNSQEAEQGVLACILLAPDESMATCERQGFQPDWFYDLKHRGLFECLQRMHREQKAIDLVTVQQRLKDYGHLESVGGLGYIASLPDAVPSAANLEYYLAIVREKYVIRRYIQFSNQAVDKLYTWEGEIDAVLEDVYREFDAVAQLRQDPTATSTLLRPAIEFAEPVFNRWFGDGKQEEEPGFLLPEDAFSKFPFRIRLKEMSLCLGEKGKGKTTMLSYLALHLMGQGCKAVIASMEMPADQTLETLLRQLLGVKRLPDTPSAQRLYGAAMAWLNQRCEILHYQGIIQHRQLLEEFKRAADRGCNIFVVDNIMKLGLLEDDMAGHGQAANEFSAFPVSSNSALFVVNHLNKSDGHVRSRSRGSARWGDASNNVFAVERNEKKWEKISPWNDRLEAKTIEYEEWQDKTRELRQEWDAKFILTNQRLQGSRQNAARELWFLFAGSQYADHNRPLPEQSTNWLEKWTETGSAEKT